MHPYLTEMEAERQGWYEITGLVRRLTEPEQLEPGYYRDPDWSVRDVVAHFGTWLAEADLQFQRMLAGTYEGHEDVDIDGLNAALLEAMHDQPWDVVWIQANAGRAIMLENWVQLGEQRAEAAWWIQKSAAPHYGEHLPRLRDWVKELLDSRHSAVGSASE